MAGLLALPLACSRDDAAGPIGGSPLDDLPEISANLLALTAEVQGAGVRLRWIWSDRNPYPGMAIERSIEDQNQHSLIAGPFQCPLTDHLDPDVASGVVYAYRARCYDAQQQAVAVSPWVPVAIGVDPVFTVNGGEAVAGATPVHADLLATTADAMRVAWGPDPSQEAWQPAQRGFDLVPAGSGAHAVACQVRYPDGTISAPVTADFVLDLSVPLPAFTVEVLLDARSVRVDATASSDPDGICPPEKLTFLWSWGDGQQTDRGAVTSATHAYTEPGVRQITLTVSDWAGHGAQVSQEADLSNRAPGAPLLQVPEDGAVDISRLPLLQWSGATDPEHDAVSYALYLGTAEPLPLVAPEIGAASWSPTVPLEAQTSYRWHVAAIDVWGDRTLSTTAGFETAANSAPAIADGPYPENQQERVSAWPRLSWSACSDPEGGHVTYDLYFGHALPLAIVAENLVEPTYQPEQLLHATTYFWRVAARDPEGAESSSRTWRFKTSVAPLTSLAALDRGSFAMGSAAASAGVGNGPHTVELSCPFWLGTHEVTNAQYVEMLMRALARRLVEYEGGQISAHGQVLLDLGTSGCRIERCSQGFSAAAGYEQHPVVGVTWCGAAAFCDWLNDFEGLPQSYFVEGASSGAWELAAGTPGATVGYRLPTEAEWEYASQIAGARTYPWGEEVPSCARANCAACQGEPVSVGAYPAAPQLADGGLYDLAGNAAEWCHDWWQSDLGSSGSTDPTGPRDGTAKLLRGGDFNASADDARCSWRMSQAPTTGSYATGFRVARTGGY